MRILLFISKKFIFPVDYRQISKDFNEQGGNVGNKVFWCALYKILNTDYNKVELCEFDEKFHILNYDIEYINNNFDVLVFPTVQICMSTAVMKTLDMYIEAIKGIKIPIVCFGVVAQARDYNDLEALCQYTREKTLRFAQAILETGGKFALRGYFTKEYFDRLGMDKDAVAVVGCQSIYQNGRDLHVEKRSVLEKEFLPIFNGNVNFLHRKEVYNLLKRYPKSVLIDQDIFVDLLYGKDVFFDELNYRQFIRYVKKYSIGGLELFGDNRIKLIADFYAWKQYIVDIHANFAFGERIHGNIISLLAGVPACVCYCDTRTREMADYFEIPNIDSKEIKGIDLYELYSNLDYSSFNANFVKKYDEFYDFLIGLGLIREGDRFVEKKDFSEVQKFEDYVNMNNEMRLLKCKYMNKMPYKICNHILERRG